MLASYRTSQRTWRAGPSGNENDTYVSNDIIYKVNNLLNSGSISRLLDKIICHNILFYDTAYSLYGFTGFGGRSVMPILQQRLIKNARPATQVMIDTYIAALGFTKTDRTFCCEMTSCPSLLR